MCWLLLPGRAVFRANRERPGSKATTNGRAGRPAPLAQRDKERRLLRNVFAREPLDER